jgi:DNA-binding MarR family transcriptional regulator
VTKKTKKLTDEAKAERKKSRSEAVKKEETDHSIVLSPVSTVESKANADVAPIRPECSPSSLFTAITLAYRDGSSTFQQALKDSSLSLSQYEILSLLSANEAKTQQMLARALCVSEGNVTQMLTRMETLGWITRRRDWRTNFVTLTRKGEKIKENASSLYRQAAADYFNVLKPAELETLSELLSALLNTKSEDS